MLEIRASLLAAWAGRHTNPWFETDKFLSMLRGGFDPPPAMQIGTTLHRIMERHIFSLQDFRARRGQQGDSQLIYDVADAQPLIACQQLDAHYAPPGTRAMREVFAKKQLTADLALTGHCDLLLPDRVVDYKSSSNQKGAASYYSNDLQGAAYAYLFDRPMVTWQIIYYKLDAKERIKFVDWQYPGSSCSDFWRPDHARVLLTAHAEELVNWLSDDDRQLLISQDPF